MTPDPWRLDGRVALVIGAGRGLGKASALELARAGAQVVFVSRTAAVVEAAVVEAAAAEAAAAEAGEEAPGVGAVWRVADASAPPRLRCLAERHRAHPQGRRRVDGVVIDVIDGA